MRATHAAAARPARPWPFSRVRVLPGCRSEIASSRYWRWFALDQDRSPVIWLVFAMRCPVKIVLHRGRSCPTFTTQTTDGKICARCSIGWAWTQLRSRMDALPATFVPRLAVVSPAVRIKPARSGSCMRRNGSIGRWLSVPMQSFSRACVRDLINRGNGGSE